MTTIDKSRRYEPSGPAIFRNGWIGKETVEKQKDRIKAGWATFALIYVAIMVLACFLITQGAMDLFELICPVCFGR